MSTKKTILLSAVILLLSVTQQVYAKIWRINNRSNYNGSSLWGDNFGGTAAYPVFTQLSQAIAFAIVNNGDTIHVEGSTETYAFAIVTKKLVIIGTGFFLTDNPKTSNNTLASKIQRIYFNAGSEGSQLIGMDIVSAGNTADRNVYVNVNGVTVKRCRIESGIVFGFPLSDVYITQNFFPDATTSKNLLFTNGNTAFVPPTDIIFNNNICQKTLVWANSSGPWPITQCKNNIFDGPDNLATANLSFSTSDFSNNILMPTNAIVDVVASAGNIKNNIGTLPTQFGTADNNLVVPAITTLFVTSTSTDGAYQIADGSAADNSGTDGTDTGAYGGASIVNRYTLSGLAPVPVIYEISTSGVADATGLPVTIKARTIK